MTTTMNKRMATTTAALVSLSNFTAIVFVAVVIVTVVVVVVFIEAVVTVRHLF